MGYSIIVICILVHVGFKLRKDATESGALLCEAGSLGS